MDVVVEVKCRKGHICVVLPGQIGPTDYPICEKCYLPMHAAGARPQRVGDAVYRQGQQS